MPMDKSDEKTRDVIDTGAPPSDAPADTSAGTQAGAAPDPGLPGSAAEMVHPYLGMMGAGASAEEGTQAISGDRLAEGATVAEPEAVEAALRGVYDPEIPVNIYDLGLIYRCEVDDNGDADIDMTLTAPACPVAGEMPQQVADAVAGVEGIGLVTVTLTWSPPWRPDMMSEDAKLALDLF